MGPDWVQLFMLAKARSVKSPNICIAAMASPECLNISVVGDHEGRLHYF